MRKEISHREFTDCHQVLHSETTHIILLHSKQLYFGGPLVVCIGGAFGAALVVLNVSLSHWEPRAVENADVHLSSALYKARINIKSHKTIAWRYLMAMII
jgi:hypothetical protein